MEISHDFQSELPTHRMIKFIICNFKKFTASCGGIGFGTCPGLRAFRYRGLGFSFTHLTIAAQYQTSSEGR
jgi:hypothetical protein